MSEKKDCPSVFHILLPMCTESTDDIFLNILKCAVARTVLDANCTTAAFMSAIEGRNVEVEMEDLTLNWEELRTEPQKIRQSGILGFWTISNFPSLGKQLFGKKHEAPQRHDICIDQHTSIGVNFIDDIVFAKMKLRIIELSVNGSTFMKLKHFVKVPGCVVKRGSGVVVSRKMESFDINGEYLQRCWKALKCGEFTLNSDDERQVDTVMYACVATVLDETEDHQYSTTNRTEPPSKRPCRRHFNKSDQGSESFDATIGDDTEGDLTGDGRMTLPPEAAKEIDDDANTGLRSIILKKFDEQMAAIIELRTQVDANRTLCERNVQSEAQIETLRNKLRSYETINVETIGENVLLRTEIETTKILREKFESDLVANSQRNGQLEEQIESLRNQMRDSEKKNLETMAENVMLRTEMEATKILREKFEVDLVTSRETNGQFKAEIEILRNQLRDSEKKNLETMAENVMLRTEVAATKKQCEKVECDLATTHGKLVEAEKVKDDLTILKRQSDTIAAELFSEIKSLTAISSKQRDVTTRTDNNKGIGISDSSAEHVSPDDNDNNHDSEFETDDPLVKENRGKLRELKFGWMKFGTNKNVKFSPGFVHPPGKDGKSKAQKINANGYPSSIKYFYFDYNENVPEDLKLESEKEKIKKLNEKFQLNLE